MKDNPKHGSQLGLGEDDRTLRPGKYLVFRVAEDHFAIPLSQVREVIAMTSMTRLPSVNESLEGVFNLRGKILSVCDLRNRLGSGANPSRKPCIIAVDVEGFEVANIVDEVLEVVSFAADQLSASVGDSSFGGMFKDHILGVARKRPPAHGIQSRSETAQERLTILLDIGRLLRLNPSPSSELGVGKHSDNQQRQADRPELTAVLSESSAGTAQPGDIVFVGSTDKSA